MTPPAPRREVVQQRLRRVTEILDYLGDLGEVTAGELQSNTERRLAVERALTRLVEGPS